MHNREIQWLGFSNQIFIVRSLTVELGLHLHIYAQPWPWMQKTKGKFNWIFYSIRSLSNIANRNFFQLFIQHQRPSTVIRRHEMLHEAPVLPHEDPEDGDALFHSAISTDWSPERKLQIHLLLICFTPFRSNPQVFAPWMAGPYHRQSSFKDKRQVENLQWHSRSLERWAWRRTRMACINEWRVIGAHNAAAVRCHLAGRMGSWTMFV
jgi:hypothetical protein